VAGVVGEHYTLKIKSLLRAVNTHWGDGLWE